MFTIWKFEFPVGDNPAIQMPKDAEILCVGNQQLGHICLWAKVDTTQPLVLRRFRVYGTGRQMQDIEAAYVGTAFDGPFVWHVFSDD